MTTMPPCSLRPNAITGDRPTGPLHLGHYVGSLRNRLDLQHTHHLTILVADLQALTDNVDTPQRIGDNIPQVMLDYLAVGLDPSRCRFVLQSAVPALAELSMLMMNLATVAHMQRNPTINQEMVHRQFKRDIPLGFFCYPVSQAADIVGLGSGAVPVGADQLPMIETTNALIDKLNARHRTRPFVRCTPVLSATPRLPGILGGTKMSKSQNNAIALGCSKEQLRQAVLKMYTDPNHIRVSDPGSIQGNVVVDFLRAFDPDRQALAELEQHYQRGGVGDMTLKKRLLGVLENELAPIRDRRATLDTPQGRAHVVEVLQEGSKQAQALAHTYLEHAKEALGVFALPKAHPQQT